MDMSTPTTQEYTINVEWRAFDPLTIDRIDHIVRLTGVAAARPGEHDFETTVTVDAETLLLAITEAVGQVEEVVPGRLVRAEPAA